MKFFFATHVLSLIDQSQCFLMNNPKGLREANEKLYALRFPEQIPQTLVSSDMEQLEGVHGRVGRRDDRQTARRLRRQRCFLLKRARTATPTPSSKRPPTMAGGWSWRSATCRRSARAISESSFSTASRSARCLRVPLGIGDARQHSCRRPVRKDRGDGARSGNLRGAGAARCEPMDLYFVGLDVIGNYLTEVNVTSPTGIQEINALRRRALGKPSGRFCRAAGRKARQRLSRNLTPPRFYAIFQFHFFWPGSSVGRAED